MSKLAIKHVDAEQENTITVWWVSDNSDRFLLRARHGRDRSFQSIAEVYLSQADGLVVNTLPLSKDNAPFLFAELKEGIDKHNCLLVGSEEATILEADA